MPNKGFLSSIVALAICQIGFLHAAAPLNQEGNKTVDKSPLPIGFFKCEAKSGSKSPMHIYGQYESQVIEYFWISQDDTMIAIQTTDDLSVVDKYIVAKLKYNKDKPVHFRSKLHNFSYTLINVEHVISSPLYSDIKFFAFGNTGIGKGKIQFLFHRNSTIQDNIKMLIHDVVVQPITRVEFATAIVKLSNFELESKRLKQHLTAFLLADSLRKEVVNNIAGSWQKVDWDQTRKQTFTLNFKEDGTYSEDGQLVNFMTNGPGAFVHTYGTGSYWIAMRHGIPIITIHCTEATTKLLFRDVEFIYRDDKIISANDPTFIYTKEK